MVATHPLITPTTYDRTDVDLSDFAKAADTFTMLGSPVRVRILWLLTEQESDVTSLAARVGVSVANVSHHLGRLRLADLVTVRSQGRRQIYSVDDPHVIALVADAVDHHADLRRRS